MKNKTLPLIIAALLLCIALSCSFCSCQSENPTGDAAQNTSTPVNTGPNFAKIYADLGNPYYCKLASDESYLSIDTNPTNIDDYTNTTAYYDIPKIIKALGLPDYLFEEMKQTRALDGRQSETFDKVSVSWSYHPDNGLEVVFKKK